MSSMTSTLDVPRGALLGDQRPRLCSVPPCVSSEGGRVADLAEAAGLVLDDWERWVLEEGLGRCAGDQWAAFEKALIVSRQNGKGAVLEALELAALFLDDFGVDLILHSAHEFKTAAEAFRRVRARGLRGDDPALAFFEWSVDPDDYDPADPRCWAQANPGLGIRITPEYIGKERAALAPDEFARERLSVGDYPVDGGNWAVITADTWGSAAAPGALL